jgi:hypothetical protein
VSDDSDEFVIVVLYRVFSNVSDMADVKLLFIFLTNLLFIVFSLLCPVMKFVLLSWHYNAVRKRAFFNYFD